MKRLIAATVTFVAIAQGQKVNLDTQTMGTLIRWDNTTKSFVIKHSSAATPLGSHLFAAHAGGPGSPVASPKTGGFVGIFGGPGWTGAIAGGVHFPVAGFQVYMDMAAGAKVSPWALPVTVYNRVSPDPGVSSDGVGLFVTTLTSNGGNSFGIEAEAYDIENVNVLKSITQIVVSGGGTLATATVPSHGVIASQAISIQGSATTALNRNVTVLGVTDANTFTFVPTGVSDGTYTNGSDSTLTMIPVSGNPSPAIVSAEMGVSPYVEGSQANGFVSTAAGIVPSQSAFYANEGLGSPRARWTHGLNLGLKGSDSFIHLNKTSELGTAGLFRIHLTPDFAILQNTAAARNFSTQYTPFSIDVNGQIETRQGGAVAGRFGAVDGSSAVVMGSKTAHALQLLAGDSPKFQVNTGGTVASIGIPFASLGTPNNGSFVWCTDCNVATPCTGGGAGAFAFRSGAQWKCPF